MTRPTIGAALLAALCFTPTTFAQEAPQEPAKAACAGEGCDEGRTLRYSGADGAATLCAKKEGQTWKVELTRTSPIAGGDVERRYQLAFPASEEADRELEALFAEAPQDPAEWERRLEALARVDLDLGPPRASLQDDDSTQGEDDGSLSERVKQEMREALEELRELIGGDAKDEAEGEEAGATTPRRDEVVLMSGERLTGELISMDARWVRIRTDDGERQFSRAEVKSVTLARSAETARDGDERQARPTLGVSVVPAADGEGLRVERVSEGSPAAKAGLQPRDVILAFDDVAVRDAAHLRQLIGERAGEEPVSLTIRRGDERLDLQVDLGAGLSVPAENRERAPY